MKRILGWSGFLTFALLLVFPAQSQAEDHDAKFYQKQFDQFSKVIAQLKNADVSEETTQDIELIRTWISQAQAFLASEKLDPIEPLMKKIEAQSEYIKAKQDRIMTESQAEEAEHQAQVGESTVQRSKKALDEASEKIKELEGQDQK